MERRTTLLFCLFALLLGSQWAQAQEAKPTEPLVVEILDPHHPKNDGRLRDDAPPVFFEGKQAKSLMALRAAIKQRVGRGKAEKGVGSVAPGIYASQRELTIRIDPTQAFAWTQGILQLISFVPGRPPETELRQSPLIYKVMLERSDTGERFKNWLPVDQGLGVRAASKFVAISMHVPKLERSDASFDREVLFRAVLGQELLGASKGLAFHSAKMLRTSLLLEPNTTFLKISRFLGVALEEESASRLKIQCEPYVPSIYVFELLRLAEAAGYKRVMYSGLGPTLFSELEAGAFKDAEGISDQLENVLFETPQPNVGDSSFEMEELEEPLELEELEEPGEIVEEEPLAEEAPGDPIITSGQQANSDPVGAALEWLAAHQFPDGRWDADGFHARCKQAGHAVCEGPGEAQHDVGVTGLAALAFLGAGNDHRTGRYAKNVRNALNWLVKQQDPEGCIGKRSHNSFTYGHAIATLAITKAYAQSQSGVWKSSGQAAVNFILKAQNPYRGWRYGVRPGDNDASVTGLMLLALRSAQAAGLEFDQNSIAMGMSLIDDLTDPKTGRTGYTKRGDWPVRQAGDVERWPSELSESLTALGLVVRILHDKKPQSVADAHKDSLRLIQQSLPSWGEDAKSADMYYWFWGTMATYLVGGKSWDSWSSALKREVLPKQAIAGDLKGSFDPIGPWGEQGGRVYSTALMTLSLQVYLNYGRSIVSFPNK